MVVVVIVEVVVAEVVVVVEDVEDVEDVAAPAQAGAVFVTTFVLPLLLDMNYKTNVI